MVERASAGAGPGRRHAPTRSTVEADLLVSTIPGEAQTPALLRRLPHLPAVFEVVYDPWPTPLARAVTQDGRRLVAGLDLLAHQAVGTGAADDRADGVGRPAAGGGQPGARAQGCADRAPIGLSIP